MSRYANIEHQAWVLVMLLFSVNCLFAFSLAYGVSSPFFDRGLSMLLEVAGILILAFLTFGLFLVVVRKLETKVSKYIWKRRIFKRFAMLLRK
ncbi:MAG: hypothetical protein ACE5IO_00910 [Thermoplasmata archaeon]